MYIYMYLWARSQQIFLVTHQVHHHFTPSPAVTTPRSSSADIRRRPFESFLPRILISTWWAKTYSMLTLSHPQRRLFFKYIIHGRTHWTRLTLGYLTNSVAREFIYNNALKQHLKRCHSQTQCGIRKHTASNRFLRTQRRQVER